MNVSITTALVLAVFTLAKKFSKSDTAGNLAATFVLFSPALTRLFLDLYANHFSLCILTITVLILAFETKSFVRLVFGLVVWSSVSYIHNLSIIAFTPMIIIPLLYIRSSQLNESFTKKILVIFLSTCLIFIIGSVFLYPFIPPFVKSLIDPSQAKNLTSYTNIATNKVFVPFQPAFVINPLNAFLLGVKLFLTNKFVILGMLASVFLGISYFRKPNLPNAYFVKFLFLWLAILTLFAWQFLFGFNWLPERFILALYIPLAIVVALAIWLAISNSSSNLTKKAAYLTVFWLLLTNFPNLAMASAKGLPPSYLPEELEAYSYINSHFDSSVVLTNGLHYYWARYLLYKHKVLWGEYYVICGNKELRQYYDQDNLSTADVLADDVYTSESQARIKAIASKYDRQVIVFINERDHCGGNPGLISPKFSQKVYSKFPVAVYLLNPQ